MVKISQIEVLFIEDKIVEATESVDAIKQYSILNKIKIIGDEQKAIDYLLKEEKKSKLPKVILLDLYLPNSGALKFLEELRGNPEISKLPVIVLTTSYLENDIQKALDLGVKSYIIKPLDFSKFAEAIKQVGLAWIAVNK